MTSTRPGPDGAPDLVLLRPGRVTLAEWRAVRNGAPVRLDPEARPAVDRAAEAVAELARSDDPVYGLNTGFGKLARTRIDRGRLGELQRRIVLSHAAGVGEPLSRRVVRLMMALKLASLGRGASGVRGSTLELLEALLREDCLPVVPRRGSVGASGDLAPLAHMSLLLIGEGEADFRGERMEAAEALARAGLEAVELAPKEGLALLNGTQTSTALALDALFEMDLAFRAALLVGALSVDGGKGSVAPFDARIHALRGQPGQIEVAAALRTLLEGSGIVASHAGCEKVQDPYCLRCQPQVMGAVLDLLGAATRTLEIEANAVTDNPLVFPGENGEGPEAISGGNFHAEPVAFAADQIAIALCEVGSISERRVAFLTSPSESGLPAFLSPDPGINSGFMMAHVTAAALVAENRQLAHPASVDSIPTSANQEDHVSMATHGAARLAGMLENLQAILAIELLCAAQAVDFHAPDRSSRPLLALHERLRSRVPHMTDDRLLAPDISAARELISGTEVADLIAPLPGPLGPGGTPPTGSHR